MRRSTTIVALGAVTATAAIAAVVIDRERSTAEAALTVRVSGSALTPSTAPATPSPHPTPSSSLVISSAVTTTASPVGAKTSSPVAASTRPTAPARHARAKTRPPARRTAVLSPPSVSVGRYVRDLPPGGAAQVEVMGRHGCIDARAGSRLVLLELGVQTIMPPRSRRDPGVLLTNSSIRLSYAQLRTALAAYLQAFASCARGRPARIALGTNTDGVADRSSRYYYPFADRGADWYEDVVAPMASLAQPLGLTVVGALDLEVGFAASAAQAMQWERSYLARDDSAHLIDNGSLDACPPNYSPQIRRCGAVLDDAGRLKTWTIADYLRLISWLAPRRIEVLPQVYRPVGASKWAALDRWSGSRLAFAGVLTEWASCPDTLTDGCFGTASLPPRKGWLAMRNALARARRSDCLPPAVVDLRIDPLPSVPPSVPPASRRPPTEHGKPPGRPAASRLARKPLLP